VAVGSGRQRARATVRCRQREFANLACRCNAPDLVAGKFAKPDIAVAAECDGARLTVGGGYVVLTYFASRRDSSHAVSGVFGKPEITVTAQGNNAGRTVSMRQGKFLIVGAILTHATYRVSATEGKPQSTIERHRQCRRTCVLAWQYKVGNPAVGLQLRLSCNRQLQ